ncbi:hypothetical protein J5N97_002754 [Dioscorea zingiberensis]|uniref:Uncharacterized protein n=1 Tax=Dioscorea zingiberensis TaxID=325984 RepID=A0A9D5D5D4_9LILI|nr:hypothetical protein J5N97_002754 [Dioscorea zingiberensis]
MQRLIQQWTTFWIPKSKLLINSGCSTPLEKGIICYPNIFYCRLSSSSINGQLAMYGVTKTALLGLTKALASEMSLDTRVTCIAPRFVPTNFADFLVRNETIRKSIEEKTLLRRLGTAGDMAATAAFLASDDASYITGQTIVVAGGIHSRL